MEIIKILRKADIFKGLSDSQLSAIEKISRIKNCRKGEVIFEEGSEGTEIFILTSGRVSIELNLYKDMTTEQIYQSKDGEVFGELCLVGSHKRSALTRAIDNVTMLDIEKDALLALMNQDSLMGYRIMTNIAAITASKLRDTNIALRNILMQQKYIFGGIQ